MIDEDEAEVDLESFYVYRSLHSDESWGAVLSQSTTCRLPNISFGMKVFAKNERAAIIRARNLYERYYGSESSERMISSFATEAIGPIVAESVRNVNFNETMMRNAAKLVMKFSIVMEEEYRKHTEEVKDEQENALDSLRCAG